MTMHPSTPPPPQAPPASPTEAPPALAGRVTPVPARLLAALLVLVTLALYWPATRCDFVNYDDPGYVSENPRVQAGLTLPNVGWAFAAEAANNWHPLTWLSLMLDVNLFGGGAAGFHFTNLALHAVNAALLFWLLWKMTGAQWRSVGVAALFAWHPLHVESVAWVSERKDVLSAFFGFLALIFYVQFTQRAERQAPRMEPETQVQSPQSETEPHFNLSTYFLLAWFCFALGLMSKPMLVTWPFVMLLLDFWPLKRFKPGGAWSLIREKTPFLALAAAASVVTFVVQKQTGAVMPMESLPLGARCANALISYGVYLKKLFWPEDLAVIYPYPGHWPLAQVVLAGILLAGISAFACRQRKRHPFFLTGWLWYLGTLVPVIGLVQVGSQAMADRYTYIPSMGVLILTVWGACELTCRWRCQRGVLLVAGAAAAVLCLALTRHQIEYWRNSVTLFRHTLAVTANNPIAHNNLGLALADQGQYDAATGQYQDALRLQPDYADAHNNFGITLLAQDQTNAALDQFQTALRLNPKDPQVNYNLGSLLAKQGRTDAAISQFQTALRLNPDYVAAHNNLGNLLAKQGQPEAAVSQFQAALRLNPGDANVHYNLGTLRYQQRRMGAAISEFQEVLRLQPDNAIAHNSLGIALGGEGRLDAAIQEFQEALRFKPDYANAQGNLARVLALRKNTQAPATDRLHP